MANAPAPPAGAVTPAGFAQSILKNLGAPATPQNVDSIVSWEAREGGNWHNTARANPLNTTENAPGATSVNGVGVKSYLNWAQGEQATANTLKNGMYNDVVAALRAGKGLSGSYAGLSKWSGGGYSSLDGSSANYNPTSSNALPSNGDSNTLPASGDTALSARAAGARAFLEAAQQNAEGKTSNPLADFNSEVGVGKIPSVATAQAALGTTNKLPSTSQYNSVVNAATAIANHQYNYEWGGGHNPSASPTHGAGHGSGAGIGFDCSGALSAVLMQSGVLKSPLVAAQFADLGRYVPGAAPGVGGQNSITVYANATHTFAKIGNQYFGTSNSNPGGGAGFFKAAQTAGYQVWHVSL